MKIDPIIKQIQTYCPSFKLVAGALTVELKAAVSDGEDKLPAAYVVRLDESGEYNDGLSNDYRQEIEEQFGVLVFVNNRKQDVRGQRAADQLEDLRAELFKALLQWCPSEAHDPIEYVGGSVQSIDKDRIAYAFEFKTTTVMTIEDSWRQVEYDAMPRLTKVHVDVDKIEDPDEKPDGEIEAGFDVNFTNGA